MCFSHKISIFYDIQLQYITGFIVFLNHIIIYVSFILFFILFGCISISLRTFRTERKLENKTELEMTKHF